MRSEEEKARAMEVVEGMVGSMGDPVMELARAMAAYNTILEELGFNQLEGETEEEMEARIPTIPRSHFEEAWALADMLLRKAGHFVAGVMKVLDRVREKVGTEPFREIVADVVAEDGLDPVAEAEKLIE